MRAKQMPLWTLEARDATHEGQTVRRHFSCNKSRATRALLISFHLKLQGLVCAPWSTVTIESAIRPAYFEVIKVSRTRLDAVRGCGYTGLTSNNGQSLRRSGSLGSSLELAVSSAHVRPASPVEATPSC